ncbi:putative peptide zinc metalloprotease protein [Humibacillus xanthopallidus]|uniref:Putative peptide zinc metalloprotease protein n=1 Tax=Humibacillus xanthopallidus TaxID=412689 RepID=A0A543PQD6_9MICO|nr:putative peptide zinc metalloprotease protein [Humibacillus xanthopallidus]
MTLHPDVTWRASKRGLVLASPSSGTVLFEHPRSAALVDLLVDDPTPEELRRKLGPPLQDDLVEMLVRAEILTEDHANGTAVRQPSSVHVTASGITFPGIAMPARWLDSVAVPPLTSWTGRLTSAMLLAGGAVALVAGRPSLPAYSGQPALEAGLMLLILLLMNVGHELAHATALVHFGRKPTRAGFGFYWGALSFYVDSTPALTLARRQRLIQALAGLGVDAVALAVCAIGAQLSPSPLLASVLWRVAALGLVGWLLNAAPILDVDGHWALADWLDEPDLAPRARRSCAVVLRGGRPEERWLAAYGACSLVAGVLMIAAAAYVFWTSTGPLVVALFKGTPVEIALGLYLVVPLALGLVASSLGMLIDLAVAPERTRL